MLPVSILLLLAALALVALKSAAFRVNTSRHFVSTALHRSPSRLLSFADDKHSPLRVSAILFHQLAQMISNDETILPVCFRLVFSDNSHHISTFEIELIDNQCWEKAVIEGLLPLCHAWRGLKVNQDSNPLSLSISRTLQQSADHLFLATEITGCIVTAQVACEHFLAAGKVLQSFSYPQHNAIETKIQRIGQHFIKFACQFESNQLTT